MRFFIIVIFVLLGIDSYSQSEEFNKKFELAKRYENHGSYGKAEQYFWQCYRLDSTNSELLQQMYQFYVRQNNWQLIAKFSKKLQVLFPEEAKQFYQQEVLSYFYLENYGKAEEVYKVCRKKFIINDAEELRACQKLADNIAFAKEAVKKPVPFNPINLGAQINTDEAEYLPNLTQDDKYIIFTRRTRSSQVPGLQEDFFTSKINNENLWYKAQPLSRAINTPQNEGAPSISADGTLLYFAACNRKDGMGECDIYYSYNRGNYWTTPKNLKVINSEYWDSQPNLSANGKTLYFVSNRPGGKGGTDIWASSINVDGSFGEPYNLGAQINTEYDEISPFIHFDNKTLYFASDGWPGMGSKDIFMNKKDLYGNWSVSENLGYPINSSKSDNSFFVAPDGMFAYFSSSREGGYGKEDIYKFELYEKIRPEKTAYFKAIVLDANTKKPLEVHYTITASEDTSAIFPKISKGGIISVGLKANRKYTISAYADGYLYYSSFIDSISEDSLKLIEQKIYLQPVAKDKQFELKNIEFDFDKAILKASSTKELDWFASYLKSNSKIQILIEGHTDNKGKADYNLKLSENRAEAVRKYLLTQNIAGDRIQTKGFGSTEMVFKEENLQDKNRRVVIRIIEK